MNNGEIILNSLKTIHGIFNNALLNNAIVSQFKIKRNFKYFEHILIMSLFKRGPPNLPGHTAAKTHVTIMSRESEK